MASTSLVATSRLSTRIWLTAMRAGAFHLSMYSWMNMKKDCADMNPGSSRPRSCSICRARPATKAGSRKDGAVACGQKD